MDAEIIIDGKSYSAKGNTGSDDIEKFEILKPLSSVEKIKVKAAGNGKVSWLVRQTGLKWQVRNAFAEIDANEVISVGPIRNTLSSRNEVILAALTEIKEPYVHRMQNINKCRIERYDLENKKLVIHVDEITGDYQEIQIFNTPGPPVAVENVKNGFYESVRANVFAVEPQGTGKTVIKF